MVRVVQRVTQTRDFRKRPKRFSIEQLRAEEAALRQRIETEKERIQRQQDRLRNRYSRIQSFIDATVNPVHRKTLDSSSSHLKDSRKSNLLVFSAPGKCVKYVQAPRGDRNVKDRGKAGFLPQNAKKRQPDALPETVNHDVSSFLSPPRSGFVPLVFLFSSRFLFCTWARQPTGMRRRLCI
jgi:hypothetical protein